jgi:hypothetical protein
MSISTKGEPVRKPRITLSYANIMSTLAVFLVVAGGTAFAVSKKINGKQLKAHSVPGSKLKKNSIGDPQIKEAFTPSRAKVAASAETVEGLVLSGPTPPPVAKGGARISADEGGGSLVQMAVGETVTIIDNPPFKVEGTCVDLGAGKYEFVQSATSTEPEWFAASNLADGAQVHGPGDSVKLFSYAWGPESIAKPFQAVPASVLSAPATDSALNIGSSSVGIQIQGADCNISLSATGR